MRIFLIGYMGCGKSTIGRKLAELMDCSFIDLDKYIEERHFKKIPAIFAEEGEAAFREKERNALREVAQFDSVVVGTGGGAPCFFDNMETMRAAGITVYIAPPVEVLANRLIKSKTERPLIAGKSIEQLMEFIRQALTVRSKFYEQAQIIIRDHADLQAEEVKTEIDKLQEP